MGNSSNELHGVSLLVGDVGLATPSAATAAKNLAGGRADHLEEIGRHHGEELLRIKAGRMKVVQLGAIEDKQVPGIGQAGIRMGAVGLRGKCLGCLCRLVEGPGLQGGPQEDGLDAGVLERFSRNKKSPGCAVGFRQLGRDREFPGQALGDCLRCKNLLDQFGGRYGSRWIWRKWSVAAPK